MSAETPEVKPDILIVEATYGVQSLPPVALREKRFTELVHSTLKRGGRCLIPVFALGRAQELLLILDEYWQANPSLHKIPIYYASALAKKCMAVYQTYTYMMNKKIQAQVLLHIILSFSIVRELML
jgi:cleavage and polyadenylation specificity factor subunit 3